MEVQGLARIEAGQEAKGKKQLGPLGFPVSKSQLAVVSFLLTSPSPFHLSSRVSGVISDFCKNSSHERYNSCNVKCMQMKTGEVSRLW